MPQVKTTHYESSGREDSADDDNSHCKTIKGYKGGYCASAGFVCKCY